MTSGMPDFDFYHATCGIDICLFFKRSLSVGRMVAAEAQNTCQVKQGRDKCEVLDYSFALISNDLVLK